jgi:glucuronosyltransferase
MKHPLSLAVAFLFVTVYTTSFQVKNVEGAKILAVSFMSSKSHKILYEPLLRELARRGHEVTALSPVASKEEKNFKNVLLPDKESGGGPNFFDLKLIMPAWVEAVFNPFLLIATMLPGRCLDCYKLPQVQEVLKEKWDLVFFVPFINECVYGLVHKLNTTTVLFTTTSIFPWIADNLGAPNPPSHVSSLLVGYDQKMHFGQRLFNFVRVIYDWAIFNLYYVPKMENVYRTALGDPTIPGIKEIERNASIVLSASHISFSPPRPLLPDMIEVGGMHLVPPKPVEPKELDDFLTGAKDGFIYFSMGSVTKGILMPENYRKLFLNVFSKLKQRVLWKWETETMEDLPPNVKLSKWVPQQDVLGHKNIRVFITHGGLGSTTEAIYHGVPLIGIPLLGDQVSNMVKAAEKGFALPHLEFSELTEEMLLDAINTALNVPSYRETAQKLSSIFRDQQTQPLDRAVYWVEYVLRHKGAVHLRSAARDLNYIQYFSIDVMAVLLVISVVALTVNVIIIKALLRKCFGVKTTKAVGVNKKKL